MQEMTIEQYLQQAKYIPEKYREELTSAGTLPSVLQSMEVKTPPKQGRILPARYMSAANSPKKGLTQRRH